MRFLATMVIGLTAVAIAQADIGRLRVIVPADAELVVNGTKSQNPSGERVIVSQDLEDGVNFYYELEASAYRNGQWYTERKTVAVEAGWETKVTFYFPEERPAAIAPQYSRGYSYEAPQYSSGGMAGPGLAGGGFAGQGYLSGGGNPPGGYRNPPSTQQFRIMQVQQQIQNQMNNFIGGYRPGGGFGGFGGFGRRP